MKSFCRVLILLSGYFFMLVLGGCGIAGDPNAPVEDDSVTLRATVNPPEVNSDSIMAAKYSSTDVFDAILKSSICSVNGNRVEFSINPTTRELVIEKLVPSAAYDISLELGGINLRAIEPHSSRTITFPAGISLQTTAESNIFEAYAKEGSMSSAALTAYSPSIAEVVMLTNLLKAELEKSSATKESIASLLDTNLKALMARKTFAEIFSRDQGAFNFNGKWVGSVFYSLHNSVGVPAILVKADAKMTLNCTGSSLYGSASFVPTAVVPLLKDMSGISTPSEISFSLSGTCQNSFAHFTRKGLFGPLEGKNLDEWEIFPINGGIACRVKNIDSSYNTGMQALPGDFVLTKSSD